MRDYLIYALINLGVIWACALTLPVIIVSTAKVIINYKARIQQNLNDRQKEQDLQIYRLICDQFFEGGPSDGDVGQQPDSVASNAG